MEDFLSTAVNVTANRGNSLINRKMILRILGILLFMEAMMFLACAGVSLCYGEEDYIYFIYTTLINMAVGSGLILLGRGAENRVTRRDGYCIVAFTWLLFTGFGMLPFYISGSIPSVTDAFFETMSGFTTTGATILDDIEDSFARHAVLAKLLAVDWRIGNRVLYDCRTAYLWSGQSGAFLGGGYGGDARQDSSENQRHGTMSVDGISRADCGRNCTAADWRHGFV